MVEKIGTIKNPLTIIAIFAGIAEVSMSAVLPFVGSEAQHLFLWFVMGFPCILVASFFATLNFNHAVLYAPSDYQDEENFVRSLPRASLEEKIKKMETELDQFEPKQAASTSNVEAVSYKEGALSNNPAVQQLYAEDMVIRILENEYKTTIQKDVRLGEYAVDGVIRRGNYVTIMEIQVCKEPISLDKVRELVTRLERVTEDFPRKLRFSFDFLLVLVADEGAQEAAFTREALDYLQSSNGPAYPIALRYFRLVDLLNQPEF